MQGTVQLSEDRHSQRLPASRDQPCQQRSVAHALNPFLLWRQWPSSKETLQGLALEEQGNGTVGRLLSPGDKSTLPAKKPPHQSCPCCIGRLGVLQVQCTFKHCLAHRRVEQLAERLPVVSISQRLRYYNSTPSSCVAPIVDSVVRGSELYSTSRSTEQDNPMHSALAVADLWRSWRWKAGVVWILLCLLSWVLVWILLGLLGGSQCGYY